VKFRGNFYLDVYTWLQLAAIPYLNPYYIINILLKNLVDFSYTWMVPNYQYKYVYFQNHLTIPNLTFLELQFIFSASFQWDFFTYHINIDV
jgi:hypothetical protein